MSVFKVDEERVRWLRLRAHGLATDTAASLAAVVVRAVVGVQAQESPAAALSIRARGRGVVAADAQRALEVDRSLVRGWFMRSTLHLVAADDVGWLLGLLGPVFIRQGERRRLELGLDEATSIRGVALMAEILGARGPLLRAEIAERLAPHGIRLEGQATIHLIALAALQGVVCHGPERDGEPTYTLTSGWIGKVEAQPAEEASVALVHRYLSAYGPARPEDMAAWSGLPISQVRPAWEMCLPELMALQLGEQTLWMVESQAAWLDEPLPAEPVVRLLPRYDTYLLGYRGRELTVAPEFARRIHPGGGIIHPVLLVNGRAAGTWQMKRRRDRVQVVVELFEAVRPAVHRLLAAEVEDVGRFLGMEAVLQVK